MTFENRPIPYLDVKDSPRRPQWRSREDAQTKEAAVR